MLVSLWVPGTPPLAWVSGEEEWGLSIGGLDAETHPAGSADCECGSAGNEMRARLRSVWRRSDPEILEDSCL